MSLAFVACEICKQNHATNSFHCNSCLKKHHLCDICLEENREKLKIRNVYKNTIYDSNLEKWR